MANFQPIPKHHRFIDLTGKRFGRWTVVKFAFTIPSGQKTGTRTFWFCRCVCGTEKNVDGSTLRGGASRSCGCLTADATGNRRRTHGMSETREYKIWQMMIDRCHNPNSRRFSYYGGRGIQVCERWRKAFAAFIADMGPRPSARHSIERTNNDGNYEPSNCHWATLAEQRNNQRNNHVLTHNGLTKTISQWANTVGLHRKTIAARLKRGMSVSEALSKD